MYFMCWIHNILVSTWYNGSSVMAISFVIYINIHIWYYTKNMHYDLIDVFVRGLPPQFQLHILFKFVTDVVVKNNYNWNGEGTYIVVFN